tara:strand:- start:5 stop:205 length:201 start_codon:yes stop_codon:yes gene_type:complete
MIKKDPEENKANKLVILLRFFDASNTNIDKSKNRIHSPKSIDCREFLKNTLPINVKKGVIGPITEG